jgi:2-polyprenyl-6-methoxyphenol hydroxylase-like FAD-dependent oxidoreductase
MVPQFLTEAVMRERLAELGHQPEFGRELTGFSQDAKGVTAQVGGGVVRAHYLIGTDGGHSLVRHSLGIDFPGETLGVRAIVADVELEGIGRDAWHRFGSDMRQILLCPLAGTQLFQVQGPVPLEGDVDLTAEGLTKLIAERTGRDIVIRSVTWGSAYWMNARLADRYRVGRVFLAGDAAHIHPPTGGQGLNTSVQDSYNLGWKLAAVLGGAPEKLLATYEEERRPIAAGMLGLATRLLDEGKQGTMRRGRETRQLDLGYPGTSLALQTRERARVRAGGARRSGPADPAVFIVPRSALDAVGLRSRPRCSCTATWSARPCRRPERRRGGCRRPHPRRLRHIARRLGAGPAGWVCRRHHRGRRCNGA